MPDSTEKVDWLEDRCGPTVKWTSLAVRKAREFASFLTERDDLGATCIEARQLDESSWVIVEVEVDVGQMPVVDISRRERIAIGFHEADRTWPVALAIRADFPRELSHTFLVPASAPVGLCLSEEPWDELKRRWSPNLLLRLLRHWLIETARGNLHAEDQALEPFVMGTVHRAILPAEVFDADACDTSKLYGYLVNEPAPGIPQVVRFFTEPQNQRGNVGYVVASFLLPAQRHGVIRSAPETIADLRAVLSVDGFDLESGLIGQTKVWLANADLRAAKVILLVGVPLTRDADREVEQTTLRLFLLEATVRELGVALGIWFVAGGNEGVALAGENAIAGAEHIDVTVLNPAFEITREAAATYNGYGAPTASKYLAIGAGSLGSQIITNLARFGESIIGVADSDFLLPHNQARHGLFAHQLVGLGKAGLVACQINDLAPGTIDTAGFRVNVLQPSGRFEQGYREALAECSIILDLAASVAVSRHLALEVEAEARRVSAFLSPSGHDLVVLVEDEARETRLDHLEMAYYSAIVGDERLTGHLTTVGHVRYAQSCREVSSEISQAFVGAFAGIASHAIRRALGTADALASVWRMNPDTMEVARIDIDVRPMRSHQAGEWTICVTAALLDWVDAQRASRLPNETGGVLLGDFDSSRKVIYLASALARPSDSKEEASGFIRGAQGLAEEIEAIRAQTQLMLCYVGEWHSHPRGHGVRPSGDDIGLYLYMAGHMAVEGFPPVMMIAGDNEFSLVVDGTRTPFTRPGET